MIGWPHTTAGYLNASPNTADMARIRSLKPETAADMKLAARSIEARYTFLLLISQADDFGLVLGEPRQLLGQLYPHDSEITEKELHGWLAELLNHGFIRWRRTRDGARVVEIVNWSKHQKVKNPGKPLLLERLAPIDAEDAASLRRPAVESPEDSGRNLAADRERERDREKGKGTYGLSADVFAEAWKAYPRRPNNSRAKAWRAWQARVREGIDPAAMLAGVQAYAAYVQRTSTEPRFVKQAATFFGPDHPFADDYGQAQAEADGWNPDGTIRTYTADGLSFTPAFLQATGQKAPA